MESQKVLIMPDRSNRLRREENPPYPEFGIQVLREVLKINEGVGETKGAVKTLESELKTRGNAWELPSKHWTGTRRSWTRSKATCTV